MNFIWNCYGCGMPVADGTGYLQRNGARWLAMHKQCDPGGDTYWIAIERIRTDAQLMRWTAHLQEKRWLGSTDWRHLLRRLADQVAAR